MTLASASISSSPTMYIQASGLVVHILPQPKRCLALQKGPGPRQPTVPLQCSPPAVPSLQRFLRGLAMQRVQYLVRQLGHSLGLAYGSINGAFGSERTSNGGCLDARK